MKGILPILAFAISFMGGWLIFGSSEEPKEKELVVSSRREVVSTIGVEVKVRRLAGKIRRFESYQDQVREVIALATSLPVNEIKEWHAKSFLKSLDADLENLFINITSERWLEADPRGYMEWATMMQSRHRDLHLAQWAARDLDGAVAYVRRLPRAEVMRGLQSMIRNLAKVDPEMAFEAAGKYLASTVEEQPTEAASILAVLAGLDLESALTLRESWTEELREKTTSGLVEVLFLNDVSRGLRFLEDEGKDWRTILKAMERGRSGKLKEMIFDRPGDLPEGWVEKMVRNSPYAFRSKKILDWFESDPETLGVSGESLRKVAMSAAWIDFGNENRGRLMALINGDQLLPAERKRLLEKQVSRWPLEDADELRDWLGGLDDPELHEAADHALEKYDEKESEATPGARNSPADLMRKLVEGESVGVWGLNERWTPNDEATAAQYMRGVSDEERVTLVERLDDRGVLTDIPRKFGAELIQDALASGSEKLAEGMADFAGRWAKEKPGEASAWVAELPSGNDRLKAAMRVARVWKDYSPTEAKAWVESLPPGERAEVMKVLDN